MPFPFLKLPGELRNRMYELVSAEEEDALVKLKNLSIERSEARNTPNINIPSTYVGLTRVCRQLCKDYLPVHQQHARVAIDYISLKAFIETFLTTDTSRVKEIQIVIGCRESEDTVDSPVDILPLLRALARFPDDSDCEIEMGWRCRCELCGTL